MSVGVSCFGLFGCKIIKSFPYGYAHTISKMILRCHHPKVVDWGKKQENAENPLANYQGSF